MIQMEQLLLNDQPELTRYHNRKQCCVKVQTTMIIAMFVLLLIMCVGFVVCGILIYIHGNISVTKLSTDLDAASRNIAAMTTYIETMSENIAQMTRDLNKITHLK